jgi:hypothetical protein
MVHNESTTAALALFLRLIRNSNPDIIPRFVMTDKDVAQINAILLVFKDMHTVVLLCWWHVLHAWRKHFSTTAYPELWSVLKGWLQEMDRAEFWATWARIQAMDAEDCPQSVKDYLHAEWLDAKYLPMWAAWARVGRYITEESDTNMLVEA